MNVFSNKKTIYFHIILLLIIGFAAYSHIFSNPFVIDDDDFILRWEAKKDLSNLPLFLKGITPEGHQGVYRPLRSLWYAAAYKLFDLNMWGYHVVSIFVLLSTTILVYLIIILIVQNYFTAFISALIFAVHPIHTESVTCMTSAFDMIGMVFIFLSFYLFLFHTEYRNEVKFYLFSILFALLGFFTYEMTLTFPLLLVLYAICFRIKKKVFLCIPYFLIAILYLGVRSYFIGIGGKGKYVLDSFYYTMLMMPKAFIKYVMLNIAPVNLEMNHQLYPGVQSMLYPGYSSDVISTFSFSDPRVLIPFLMLLLIIVYGILCFKKKPIVTFCVGWFFIALLPVSNVFPVGILMAEKYLYLSSFGYCFLIGYILEKMYKNKKARYYAVILYTFLAVFYFKATVIRNIEWNNPLMLWDSEVERFPNNSIANNNLGYAYMKIGEYEEALGYLTKAKRISLYDLNTRENIVVCLISTGNYDKAIDECMDTVKYLPEYYMNYKLHVNLSAIYNGKGMFDEAIEEAELSIKLNPYCHQAYNNLIRAYLFRGDNSEALECYNNAVSCGIQLDQFLTNELEKRF